MVTAPANPERDAYALQEAQERAVGISVYVRKDAPGYRCVLKHRYTDFLVNEILPNGEVLHLTAASSDPERKRKRENNEESAQKKQKAEEVIKEEQGPLKSTNGASEDSVDATAGAPPAVATDDTKAVEPADDKQAVKEEAIASIPDGDKAALKDVFGEQTATAVLDLYAAVIAYPDRKPRDHNTVNSQLFTEKSKRTEAHLCVRRIFKSRLETTTVQDPDQPTTISFISIKAIPKVTANSNGSSRNSNGQRGKQNWGELGGEYLHFTLYKENKDTMEVLTFLASQLKVQPRSFSFAGTKDRRGVTVQRVAVHRILRERMEHINRMARGFRLDGPWEYRPDPLDLGMLSGNEFLLTLREAHFDGEDASWDIGRRMEHAKQLAESSAKSISESGFLNYYGMQRFGTYATGTHTVGMKMLKGDLKGAVDAILSYDPTLLNDGGTASEAVLKVPYDDVARAEGIAAFLASGSSGKAISTIPRRFTAERSLITHLGKRERDGKHPNANDFQGALMGIQRNLRSMYVHAYQSFVWNTIVGKRWETHGPSVVEGDLVVVGEKDRQEGISNGTASQVKQEVDENGEPIIHPLASASNVQDLEASAGALEDPFVRARPLTKAEAESGRYNIFDLVLPLPGYDVLYPSNAIGQLYKEFMSSDLGGGLDPHDMRRAWKEISLSGGYRKMMARPLGHGVKAEVKAYSAPEEQMVQTDLEIILENNRDDESARNNDPQANLAAFDQEQDKIALILKFQLGSSQYATIMLRELTKGGVVGYRPEFSAANR